MTIKTQNVGGGQKIVTSFPPSAESDVVPDKSGKMGGSPTDLSHSLKGASAVQDTSKGK